MSGSARIDDASEGHSVAGVLCADAVRRLVDIIAASLLLTLLAPVWLSILLVRAAFGRPLATAARLGRERRPFTAFRFNLGASPLAATLRRLGVERWPEILNLLAGQISLVGPRAVAPDEPGVDERSADARFHVKPGWVCLWWIRERANIPFGGELAADAEYVANRSLRGDAGILLRALVAACYGARRSEPAESIQLFDLPLSNLTMDDAIARMIAQSRASLANGEEPRQVCFVNADCVNLSFRRADYRAVLEASWMNLADGIGMKIAGRAFDQEIRENLCGTDVFLRLCEAAADAGKSFFLLGGKPGVVEDLTSWMAERFPRTRVAGSHHGYFSPQEEPAVIRQIAASRADVLLVAFGAPRQDLWIAWHLRACGVKLALGVGGLFDYYSGRIPRAPLWVREIGMEWAFRLYQEPKRLWKRYLWGNGLFLARTLWWKGLGKGKMKNEKKNARCR